MTGSRLCDTAGIDLFRLYRLGCYDYGIESRNYHEHVFFVDTDRTTPVEPDGEITEQAADVAICALHGGKTTRVIAGQGLADEPPQRLGAHTQCFGPLGMEPWLTSQTALTSFVQ